MKRIHLFEFEDFAWFPNTLRIGLTRLIVVMHKLLGSSADLQQLLGRALAHSERAAIVDLCSGSGGPMLEAFQALKQEPGRQHLQLTLTDLYPNLELAARINGQKAGIRYETRSIDATRVDAELRGVRTMICSLHHMRPEVARGILQDARDQHQPICVYEISDNSFPISLWWLALLPNFLMVLFITPFARPLTLRQLFFTYIVPVIPLCFAWDGAVSNARTYTLADMAILLEGLQATDYTWKTGRIAGKAKKLYLLGLPKAH
ncbi:hypothetical protein FY528_09320 [Hymenobacter lutimineralis]|uniref:Class I SAM-dependent methyltransferase n=1 Tax=Hymenobacter lutimineralis TaxID=2606448 RepID=A0A5D6V3D2_9BACT|nr:hypothetical protein [Hymenobacter lutimineralis]TYZ10056.1 hypothetical protein FY528_09320 [Hymenobacter lutimineralis]